jgi:hypothetical protein
MPKKDQQGYYGFDPSGLERAAQVFYFLLILFQLGRQIS